MSENTTEFDFEQHRKKWFARLVGELDRAEKFMPVKFLPDGVEHPQWVENVERELALVLLPAAKLRKANFAITPRRMGALTGHGCGMAVWLVEWLESIVESSEKIEGVTLTEVDMQEVEKFLGGLCDWYQAMRRLAKLALCSCVDQPYEDMTHFLTGFADGFSRKPKTFKGSDMGNPTFEIYRLMIVFWKPIERLNSVREFHELLVKVFGANRVGDQKRIEKICQRIGLRFGKPGRPKKK